ncbi:MAG: hypothetical protein QOH61_1993 [Chloroflexota bacterium]|jgi:hypothetical protein|nr:hypothetical protein [Chloroflexota bacterium]
MTSEHEHPATVADPLTRLDVVEARLAALSRAAYRPDALGDPDPGSEERWDAARVWAHLCEFPAYWTAEARRIVERGPSPDEPLAFGRLKDDAGRVGAVERDRLKPREKLWTGVHDGIEGARAFFPSLTEEQLELVGQHPSRGPKPVRFIYEQFVINHLEEHADQLDKLAAWATEDGPRPD